MDISEISTLITSVGFPIVMCLMLFSYMTKLNEQHETEMNTLKDTINANTQVLTELSTLIKTFIDTEDRKA